MKELTDLFMLNESDSSDSGSDDEVTSSPVARTSNEEATEVRGTYNKKYTDAAHFWKPRPYFAKHWKWG